MTIDWTTRNMQQLEPILGAVPEVESTFLIAGVPEVTRGIAVIRLKPWEERTRSQEEIARTCGQLAKVPGVVAVASSPPSWARTGAARPCSSCSRPAAATRTGRGHRPVRARSRAGRAFTDVNGELSLDAPQLDVTFDRQKIADLGLSVDSVGRTLESFLAGREVTRFNRDAEQYEVIVQVADSDRKEPDDLRRSMSAAAAGR